MESLRYETELEDAVAFNVFDVRTTDSGRSMQRRGMLTAGTLGAIAGLPLPAYMHSTAYLAFPVAAGILAALLYRPFLISEIPKIVRRQHAAGGRGAVGWHQLTLDQLALLEESETGSQTTKYSALHRLAETQDHVFLYISPTQAHIIPRKKVTLGDVQRFLSELRDRIREGAG